MSAPAMPRTGRSLTRREKEVAQLTAEGLENKEIATRLHISPKTVEFHLKTISQKLQCTRRSLIFAMGLAEGERQTVKEIIEMIQNRPPTISGKHLIEAISARYAMLQAFRRETLLMVPLAEKDLLERIVKLVRMLRAEKPDLLSLFGQMVYQMEISARKP